MRTQSLSLVVGECQLADNPNTASEAGTLAQARAGGVEAFGRLVCTHQRSVYSLALRMLGVREDAEELAQDVFLLLHRNLGAIVSAAHLVFWLRRTVCHRAIDRLRSRPRVKLVPLEAAGEVAADGATADPIWDRQLRARVAQLAPSARAVVLLRYQEDLDPLQISRVLGLPVNTVKSHLKRSLAVLRRVDEPARSQGGGGRL
jgi:RNA polymerase sigma-70 factor (ECF subfamily)